MRLFRFVTLLILMGIGTQASSQYYYYNDNYYDKDLLFEVGGSIGGMMCITDLGGSKGKPFYLSDMNLKNTQAAGGFYFGVIYQNLVAVRLEATWGSVKAYDSILKGGGAASIDRYNRNLNFQSNINEVSLVGEFHPLALKYTDAPPRLSPYVAAGIGYYTFRPQGVVNGRTYDLRALRLEGQGFSEYPQSENYHLNQVNIPVGLGLRYEISPLFHARVEFMHRFLFTDHLDDVSGNYIDPALFSKYLSPIQASQANAVYSLKRTPANLTGYPRGNSKNKDSYMTISVKLGMTLGRMSRY